MIKATLLTGAAVALFLLIWRRLPSTPGRHADRAETTWRDRRRRAGASHDEIEAERHLRLQIARLRRLCSNHVLTVAGGESTWIDVMKGEIAASAATLATIDPALANRYVKVVGELTHADILYPPAFARAYPTITPLPVPATIRAGHDADRLAAFRDI